MQVRVQGFLHRRFKFENDDPALEMNKTGPSPTARDSDLVSDQNSFRRFTYYSSDSELYIPAFFIIRLIKLTMKISFAFQKKIRMENLVNWSSMVKSHSEPLKQQDRLNWNLYSWCVYNIWEIPSLGQTVWYTETSLWHWIRNWRYHKGLIHRQ